MPRDTETGSDGGGWRHWAALLDAAQNPADDDLVDALAHDAMQYAPDERWCAVLMRALAIAESALSRRSAALGVALHAGPNDRAAADCLADAYRAHRGDAFLAPAMLNAMGVAAVRSALARSELTSAVLRLRREDEPHLLIRTAKIIGQLTAIEPHAALSDHLAELTYAADARVQSEARYQRGLHLLTTALGAATTPAMWELVEQARDEFRRAGEGEEHRPDAALFLSLAEALLDVHLLCDGAHSTGAARTHAAQATRLLESHAEGVWLGYGSPAGTVLLGRVRAVLDAVSSIIESVEDCDRWLRLDDAVLGLATATYAARLVPNGSADTLPVLHGLSAARDRILFPLLGPVIRRVVGRQRMDLIIEGTTANPESTYLIAELQAIRAEVVREEAVDAQAARTSGPAIGTIAARYDRSPEEFMRAIEEELVKGGGDGILARMGILPRLPIEQPGLLGGDPAVDETARGLLHDIRARMPHMAPAVWSRLVQSVEAVVSFVGYVRDSMPAYTRRTEDGGLGRRASEDDLRDDFFRSVRERLGRSGLRETGPLAGGRADSGIGFPECMFPAECKAEHRSIDRKDVHEHYIAQADDYAAVREGLSFLLILDLRAGNAAGQQKRKKGKGGGKAAAPVSLYALQESFWIDGLPLDPQVQGAAPKTVIVGVVPGNRSFFPHASGRRAQKDDRELHYFGRWGHKRGNRIVPVEDVAKSAAEAIGG